jgi:arylsulfatase A-like enzyme
MTEIGSARGAPASVQRWLGWTLLLALVASLVTGLVHWASLLWRLHLSHRIGWQSDQVIWMAPIAYLIPFALAGSVALGGALVARRLRPGVDPVRIVAGAVLGLAGLSIALLAAGLHPVAQLIVAAAVAIRLSGPVARVSARRLGRAAVGLSVPVVTIALVSALVERIVERRALAALPRSPAGAPNVLVLILDTVRAASLSLYGYPKPTTPAIEQWARQGVTFDYAVSAAPWTLPSHAAMFTGYDAVELSTDWRTPLDDRFPTVAEVFRSRGYRTAGFVANTYYAGYDSGLERGFIHYDDYRTTLEQVLWSSTLIQTNFGRSLVWSRSWRDLARAFLRFDLTSEPLRIAQRKPATLITDRFLDWQESTAGPFFAFLNYFDAHDPYQPPADYRGLFGNGKRDRYDACIRYLDDQVDRLLATLAKRGVLDRTIVVLASDHGEYLGERGRWGHGNGMHLEVLRVPLMIRYPAKVPAGGRVGRIASLRNLPATLVELAGLTETGVPGTSLARLFGNPPDQATDVARARSTLLEDAWLDPAKQRWFEAVLTDSLHWIRSYGGDEYLFDYRKDPKEQTNLGDRPELAPLRDSLRALARPPGSTGPWNRTPKPVSTAGR